MKYILVVMFFLSLTLTTSQAENVLGPTDPVGQYELAKKYADKNLSLIHILTLPTKRIV